MILLAVNLMNIKAYEIQQTLHLLLRLNLYPLTLPNLMILYTSVSSKVTL